MDVPRGSILNVTCQQSTTRPTEDELIADSAVWASLIFEGRMVSYSGFFL